MRVLAVAELVPTPGSQPQESGHPLGRLPGRGAGAHVLGDGGVVARGVGEDLAHQAIAQGLGHPALSAERLENRLVVRRIAEDQHVVEVLGGRPQQARAADVDILHDLVEGNPRPCRRLGEGIEIHQHQVHQGDLMPLQRLEVLGLRTAGEDSGVDLGVEGLDAAVEHLGKARDGLDLHDLQPLLAQRLGSPAGGDDFEAQTVQPRGKAREALLVRD